MKYIIDFETIQINCDWNENHCKHPEGFLYCQEHFCPICKELVKP